MDRTAFASLNRRLGIAPVWSGGYEGAGVTVAVMDTGITTDPELDDAVIEKRDFTGENDPWDRADARHGTAIARDIHLVAPKAAIASFKVFPQWLPFRVRRSVVRALRHCIAEYPRYQVINLSLFLPRGFWFWRCRPERRCAVCCAVNDAAEAGIVVIAAAGNEGPRPDTIECPGGAAGAITIAATLTSAEKASFEAGNGAARSRAFGTSFSSAYVAGGAALLLSACPRASPADIRASLKRAARPLQGEPPNAQGAGLTNFGRALEALIGPSEEQFKAAEERLYFLTGNAEAQRPDNRNATEPLDLVLDYVEKVLLKQGKPCTISTIKRVQTYLVPGRLPEQEKRLHNLLSAASKSLGASKSEFVGRTGSTDANESRP